jgi:hypothetical protein
MNKLMSKGSLLILEKRNISEIFTESKNMTIFVSVFHLNELGDISGKMYFSFKNNLFR